MAPVTSELPGISDCDPCDTAPVLLPEVWFSPQIKVECFQKLIFFTNLIVLQDLYSSGT
jgi:hypothetical protein